jgi:hypothetical protein
LKDGAVDSESTNKPGESLHRSCRVETVNHIQETMSPSRLANADDASYLNCPPNAVGSHGLVKNQWSF